MLALRIVYRIWVGITRHKGAWAGGLGVTILMLGFATWTALGVQAHSSAVDVAGAAADCADVAIQALASGNAVSAHAAYRCMDGQITAQTSEASFVQQASQASTVPVSAVTRVGEHASPDGGKVVFYTLDVRGQSVGYIIYLNATGKVFKIE